MPAKIARSALNHQPGLPMVTAASAPPTCLAGRPERREYSASSGFIRGNPAKVIVDIIFSFIVLVQVCLRPRADEPLEMQWRSKS
jgi:hypothetical protein